MTSQDAIDVIPKNGKTNQKKQFNKKKQFNEKKTFFLIFFFMLSLTKHDH